MTSAVQSYTDFCLLRLKRLLVLIEYDDQILREESEMTKCDIKKNPEEPNYIHMCMYLTIFSKDINNESVRSSALF